MAVGDQVLALRRQEAAELKNLMREGVLDVAFIVAEVREALHLANLGRLGAHKVVLGVHDDDLVQSLPHLRDHVRGVSSIDGHLKERLVIGAVAIRARKRHVAVESLKPLEAVAHARRELLFQATRRHKTLDPASAQLDERFLGRGGHQVRLEAQQRAVNVEERGFDHVLFPSRSFLPLPRIADAGGPRPSRSPERTDRTCADWPS